MTEIETFDELEAGLRRAFHREPLPVAPDRLRDALVDVVDRVPTTGFARRGNRIEWGVLGIAAVLVGGGALALLGGGGWLTSPPTQPAKSTAVASDEPRVRVTYTIAWTDETPASDALRTALVATVARRLAGTPVNGVVTTDGTDHLFIDVPSSAPLVVIRQLVEPRGEVSLVPLGSQPVDDGSTVESGRFPALIDGAGVASAVLTKDQTGGPALEIDLTGPAAGQFAEYTTAHVGEFMAVTLDGVAVSVPVINSTIPDGKVVISTPANADQTPFQTLVRLVESGPLPVAIVRPSVGPLPPLPRTAAEASPPADPILPSLPPNATCPAEPTNGDRPSLSCELAIRRVLAILPQDIDPVGPIQFSHTCVDPNGRVILDCFPDGFGLVTMQLSNGNELVAQTLAGMPGVQIVAPVSGDAADQLALRAAPHPAHCASSTEDGAIFTLRIEPGQDPPVWSEAANGTPADVRFDGNVISLARPFPMLLTGSDGRIGGRWFLARNGDMIDIGLDAPVAAPGLIACSGPDGLVLSPRAP